MGGGSKKFFRKIKMGGVIIKWGGRKIEDQTQNGGVVIKRGVGTHVDFQTIILKITIFYLILYVNY